VALPFTIPSSRGISSIQFRLQEQSADVFFPILLSQRSYPRLSAWRLWFRIAICMYILYPVSYSLTGYYILTTGCSGVYQLVVRAPSPLRGPVSLKLEYVHVLLKQLMTSLQFCLRRIFVLRREEVKERWEELHDCTLH
jgi:hypothetical protein